MDNINTATREQLVALCKERGIKGYSGKKKDELISMLQTSPIVTEVASKIVRLNYIGSKFQLLDWLTDSFKEKTGLANFNGVKFADLFAGTGVVSHHFRKQGAIVLSNDAELYSSIITHAFTSSIYTDVCKKTLELFQSELDSGKYTTLMPSFTYITLNYSPHGDKSRQFFTIDNAMRIDYLRMRLEEIRTTITHDEYCFILATIISSADSVSNVPAVYGCYLKEFKSKATKALTLTPIHTMKTPPIEGTFASNSDVLNAEFLKTIDADIVYLDPPYNERQYSKNYFPLNIIAKTPKQLETEPELKGKTGIPQDCFISPFCKKGEVVESSFDTLFRDLKSKWIFVSYNSESLISKEKMLTIMEKYGEASVIEREYKRFKSFEYNADTEIKEYLFCLKKQPTITTQ